MVKIKVRHIEFQKIKLFQLIGGFRVVIGCGFFALSARCQAHGKTRAISGSDSRSNLFEDDLWSANCHSAGSAALPATVRLARFSPSTSMDGVTISVSTVAKTNPPAMALDSSVHHWVDGAP